MGWRKKLKKKLKKIRKKTIPSGVSGGVSKALSFGVPVPGVPVPGVPELKSLEQMLQDLLDASIDAVEQAQKAALDARTYAAKAASDAAELRSIMVEFKRCQFCKKIFCVCPGGN
jgi:hypothetical protein